MSRPVSTPFGRPVEGAMSRLADGVRDHRATLAVFAAVAAVQILTIAHHTSWRDEHQAWLIALASRSIAELWANLRYEGHPPLWHLLLWFAQHVSADLLMLKLVQAAIALATLAVIMFAAPFPLATRAMLGLNYVLLFEYGAFARSYGLGALLILAALAAWRSRVSWALLALAMFASLHFMLLAGALGLYRLLRKELDLPGVAVLAAGCLASLAFIWPHPDTVRPVLLDSPDVVALRTFLYGGAVLWPLTPVGGWFHGLALEVANPVAMVSAVAVWIVVARVLRGDRLAVALGLVFLVGMTFLSVVAYPLYPRHAGTLVLLIIGLIWVRALDAGEASPAFRLFAGWFALVGLIGAIAAATTNFSGGHVAAREIRQRHLQDKTWAAYPSWHSMDLAAVVGRPGLNLRQGCLQTFQIWDHPVHHLLKPGELATRLADNAHRAGDVLHLMTSENLDGIADPRLRIETLFVAARDQLGEVVRLYRIHATDAVNDGTRRPWPVCAVGTTRSAFRER